ncbi:MAG: bifunctional folylpolyglutamate synthase/dihydrofolate synthase, partial [Pseudomonadales bacterium]
ALHNVANAISAVLASDLAINQQQIVNATVNAMEQVALAGRFDYQQKQGRRWLFDVGHNEHGMRFLLQQLNQALPQLLPNKPNATKGHLLIVFSMLQDKDIQTVLSLLTDNELLQQKIVHWYIAPMDPTYVPRSAPLAYLQNQMAEFVANDELSTYDSLELASQSAIAESTEDDLILVCGSFHTICEVMQALET